MVNRHYLPNKKPAQRRPFAYTRRRSAHGEILGNDSRRHENQQFSLVVNDFAVLEQETDIGKITEKRNSLGCCLRVSCV
jgi:hypothetical protein